MSWLRRLACRIRWWLSWKHFNMRTNPNSNHPHCVDWRMQLTLKQTKCAFANGGCESACRYLDKARAVSFLISSISLRLVNPSFVEIAKPGCELFSDVYCPVVPKNRKDLNYSHLLLFNFLIIRIVEFLSSPLWRGISLGQSQRYSTNSQSFWLLFY